MVCGLWPAYSEAKMAPLAHSTSTLDHDTCEECTACETSSLKQSPAFFDRRVPVQHNLASPPESPGYIQETEEVFSDDDECRRAWSDSSLPSSIDEQPGTEPEEQQQLYYTTEQPRCQQSYGPTAPLSPSESPYFSAEGTSPETQATTHPHATSTTFNPSPIHRAISPPALDRYRRSVSQACHQRTPLDRHRRLPRAVTPDILPSSNASRGRLYSPMAAGFARLGQRHRHSAAHNQQQQQRRLSISSLAVAERSAAAATRSSELKESMALVARMFEGPA